MPVSLDPVPATEKAALRQLLDDYLHEFAALEGAPVSLDREGHVQYDWFHAYWTEKDRHPFKIVAGGELAGFCLLREMPDAWEIAEFFVAPPHRRHGVGRQAVRALAREIGSRGNKPRLIARVRQWNRQALAFWEAQGFQPIGEDGGDVVTVLDVREASRKG